MNLKTTTIALFTAALLTLFSQAQEVKYFMYFPAEPNLEGNTQDAEMSKKKAFELIDLEFGISTNINIDNVSSGGGGGRAAFLPIGFVADISDAPFASMLLALAEGNLLNRDSAEADVVIEARLSTGNARSETIFKIELKLAAFEELTVGASDGDRAFMNGTIQFGAVRVTTFRFNNNGTLEQSGQSSWSRVKNTPKFEV